MNELTVILSLLTLLVGWLLGEASQRRRELSTDKRALSRCIADLLEIRLRTYVFNSTIAQIKEKFKIPEDVLPIIISKLDVFLPNIELLQKRFNESVDSVASANPLLGFQLRSKDELPKYLKTFRQFSLQDTNAEQNYQHLEDQILEIVKSPMDDLILDLAKMHGWSTHRKIKIYLSLPIILPKKIDEFLSKNIPKI